MNFKWLIKNSTRKLIVFFNGWGCDEYQFKHLKTEDYDVLMLFEYYDLLLSDEVQQVINDYEQVSVIAWSYGVWVGQYVWQVYKLPKSNAIAINGTTLPVHDRYGIAEAVVQGTLDNLSERNLMKFQRRMLGGNDAWKKFQTDKPQRDFNEQKQELASLIQLFKNEISVGDFFDKAIVGSNDLIFTSDNQKAFWQCRAEIKELDVPHFCFYRFSSWEEICAL
jgi:biotin synthesis protein BioG